MAGKGWKRDLERMFSLIVEHVGDPASIAESLHHDCTPPIFTEKDMQEIQNMQASSSGIHRKDITRTLLNMLTYKPHYPLVGLYEAFKATDNSHLKECLVESVESYYKEQRQEVDGFDAIYGTDKLPMSQEAWKTLHEKDVVNCNMDTKDFLTSYKDEQGNYSMRSQKRGRAVIINNVRFQKKETRCGSDKDLELMQKILTQLHFDVVVYTDLTSDAIIAALQVQNKGLEGSDCFIMVVLSHGNNQGVLGTDGQAVTSQQFAEPFNPHNCPALKGKPKIFFFQACRIEGSGSASAPNPNKVKRVTGTDNNLHYLFGHSTVIGNQSCRDEQTGSWYIQALAWLLKYEAHRLDIQDILTKINALVSTVKSDGLTNWTVPEIRGSPTRKLYFFPGVTGQDSSRPMQNSYIGTVEYVSNI